MSRLACCTAALVLLLLVTPATGQEPKRELPTVMDGVLTATHLEGPFEFLGDPKGGRIRLARFDLRYRLGTLMGEPVYRFEARYELGNSLTLVRADRSQVTIAPDAGLGEGEVALQREPLGERRVTEVRVPPAIFGLFKVIDFNFSVSASHGIWDWRRSRQYGDSIRIARRYPGVMGRAGEWGWDVPGSPAWDELFCLAATGEPDLEGLKYAEAALAKEVWLGLQRHAARSTSTTGPLKALGVWDLHVNPWDLLLAIRKAEPTALDDLYRRPKDRQVSALIAAVRREVEARRQAGGSAAADQGLTGRMDLVERAVAAFGEDVSPDLRRQWQRIRRDVEVGDLERRVHRLGKMIALVAEHTADGAEPQWPEALRVQLRALRSDLEARGVRDGKLAEQVDQLALLLGLRKRPKKVWVVVAGNWDLLSSRSVPRLSFTVGAPLNETREERRRRLERERRAKQAAEERARRRAEQARREQARDRARLPADRVRSQVLKLEVPAPDDPAAKGRGEQVDAWARRELKRYLPPEPWRAEYGGHSFALICRIHRFDTEEEARSALTKLAGRAVSFDDPPKAR